MTKREEDPVAHILLCDTHDKLLFFTNKGRVLPLEHSFQLRGDTSKTTRGVPVINVIPLTSGEKVNAILGVDTLDHDDVFLLLATRRGVVKRVALSSMSNIRRSGIIIMKLKEKDETLYDWLNKA